MNKLLKVSIAMMCICVSVANATVTLEECQRMAQENYPLLKKYEIVERTTDYTLSNISKGYLPQIVLSGQATYQSDVATYPDALHSLLSANGYEMEGLKKDQYKVTLEMSQVIWDGGNIRGQKDLAQATGEAQSLQVEVEMYSIRQRVNDLYFGILLLDEKLRLNTDLKTLMESNCRKIETMNRNGVAMKSDVNKIKVELLNVNQQEISLIATRKSLVKLLSIFTGLEETAINTLERPLPVVVADRDNRRPELSLFDSQLKVAEKQERLVTASLMPRISVFAQGWYGYPGLDMFSDMMNYEWTLNGLIGLKLSWNIGNLYTHKNEKRKIAMQRESIENSREVFLFNNSLVCEQQKEYINQYRELLKEDSEIINLRQSVRKSAESKLEYGIIDVNNLLQEITLENQALINRSTHEIEMLKYMYELKNSVNQ